MTNNKKDKLKKKLKNPLDFDLLYDVLISGGSLGEYHDMMQDRTMPQEREYNKPITEDDILSAWILGKDEEMNQYKCGGHIKQGLESSYLTGTKKPVFNIDIPAFNPVTQSGILSKLGSIPGTVGAALLIADIADKGIGIGLSMLLNYGSGANDDPYRDAIYRDYSNGFISGLFNLPDTLDALNRINSSVQSFGTGDNAYLKSQYEQYNPVDKSYSNPIFGGEKRRLNVINNAIDIANNQSIQNFNTAVTNSNRLNLWNQLSQPYMAACGGKMKNRLASGGYINSHYDYITDPLVRINAGGTHQENPNEGVLTSIAPDGQPNLVEEGETIINNGLEDAYVFSDRIVADDEILKSHLLPNKFAGKTYADISKELDKIIEEHKNDEISKRTFDEMISRLQQAQEDQKYQEKAEEVTKFLDGLTDEQKELLEQTMIKEVQAEQQAAEEQAVAEQQAQEQAAQEQQMQPEQSPEQVPMEQPLEQIVPSRYDQMMSRALFADAADLGMFAQGGHLHQKKSWMKSDYIDNYGMRRDARTGNIGFDVLVRQPITSDDPKEREAARNMAKQYMAVNAAAGALPIGMSTEVAAIPYALNQGSTALAPMATSSVVAPGTAVMVPGVIPTATTGGSMGLLMALAGAGLAAGTATSSNNTDNRNTADFDLSQLAYPNLVNLNKNSNKDKSIIEKFVKKRREDQTVGKGLTFYNDSRAISSELRGPERILRVGSSSIAEQHNNKSGTSRNNTPERTNNSLINIIPLTTPTGLPVNYEYTNPNDRIPTISQEMADILGSEEKSIPEPTRKEIKEAGWKERKDGTWYKEESDGTTTDYSTWLRYAPAIGSGIQYLSDLFGITNRNDYTNPNLFQRSINAIPNVGFTPLGGYRTFNPFDETYQLNALRSMNEAARRAVINNANGNYGATLAALDALNYNTSGQFGDLALKAREYNDKERQAIDEYNLKINQINSTLSMSAQEKNQAIAALKARLTSALALMRQQIEDTNDAARSANMTNFYQNLGNVGKENFNMTMVRSNPAFYYTITDDGHILYKNGFDGLNEKDQAFVRSVAEPQAEELRKKRLEEANKKADDATNKQSDFGLLIGGRNPFSRYSLFGNFGNS